MAYKVVCTVCGKRVKMKIAKDGKSFSMGCDCLGTSYIYYPTDGGRWKVVASGKLLKEEALKYCVGCYENIYNGQNAKECWNLKSAKLVMKKKVGIDDVPPWNHIPIKCLSCYHETGFVMIGSTKRKPKQK